MLKNRIQHFRKELELTQVNLAEKAEVTRQTIISIEKGNYVPSVLLAIRLSVILKQPVEKLFYEANE